MSKLVETAQKEKEVLQAQVSVLAGKNDAKDIEMYCATLETKRLTGEGGEYVVSQAFLDVIKPIVTFSDNSQVITFDEDRQQTSREAVKSLVDSVLTMALKKSLLVLVGELAQSHTPPEQPEAPGKTMKEQIMEKFGDTAKSQVIDPTNNNEVYLMALDMAGRDGFIHE